MTSYARPLSGQEKPDPGEGRKDLEAESNPEYEQLAHPPRRLGAVLPQT